MSKAQVTLFVIVGLVLLSSLLLILYAASQYPIATNDATSELPFVTFMQKCVQEDVVQDLSYLPLVTDPEEVLHNNMSFTLILQESVQPYTLEAIEMFLIQKAKESTELCLDQFPGDISFKVQNVSTTLQTDSFFFIIQTDSQEYGELAVSVEQPLGLFLQYAADVAERVRSNTPIEVDTFAYATHHGVDIYRPYPYVLLDLYTQEFNVRVAFDSTVSQTNTSGCCRQNGICQKGVTQQACIAGNGIFTQGESCVCDTLSFTDQNCPDCDGCGQQFAHGDEQCLFIPGVGGRFYSQSCIDGRLRVEACADFKQEVCVTDQNHATCVPNLARQCSQCTDASCCSAVGQCTFEHGVCRAVVAQGFAFWNVDQDVCAQEIQPCLNCTTEQAFASAYGQCSSFGDCGVTFNIHGDVGGSFYSTYGSATVEDAQEYFEQTSLLLDNLSYTDYDPVFSPLDTAFFQPITAASTLQTYPFSWYLNGSTEENFASCQAFSPTEQACQYCASLPFGCSEYACRSLGDCRYLVDDFGFGSCRPSTETSGIALTANYSSTVVHNTTVYDLESVGYPSFTFTTDVPSQCIVTAIPGDTQRIAVSAQSATVHNFSLSTQHTTTLRNLPFWFEAQTPADFLDILLDSYYAVEQSLRSGLLSDGALALHALIAPYAEFYIAQEGNWPQTLVTGLYTNQQYVFVTCYADQQTDTVAFTYSPVCEQSFDLDVVHNLDRLTITAQQPIQCGLSATNSSDSNTYAPMQCEGFSCSALFPQTEQYIACSTVVPEASLFTVNLVANATVQDFSPVPLQNTTYTIKDSLFFTQPPYTICFSQTANVSCSSAYCELQADPGMHDVLCSPVYEAPLCAEGLTLQQVFLYSEASLEANDDM